MEQVAVEIETVVVAHRDRLARFGFDFIEWFCHLNNCQIVVLNNTYKSSFVKRILRERRLRLTGYKMANVE